MLIFDIGEKELHMQRDGLEATAQEAIHGLLEKSKMGDVSMVRSAMKMAADMLAPMMGLTIPRGVDKIEYLAAFILKQALDAIENKPIPVTVKEVKKDDGAKDQV